VGREWRREGGGWGGSGDTTKEERKKANIDKETRKYALRMKIPKSRSAANKSGGIIVCERRGIRRLSSVTFSVRRSTGCASEARRLIDYARRGHAKVPGPHEEATPRAQRRLGVRQRLGSDSPTGPSGLSQSRCVEGPPDPLLAHLHRCCFRTKGTEGATAVEGRARAQQRVLPPQPRRRRDKTAPSACLPRAIPFEIRPPGARSPHVSVATLSRFRYIKSRPPRSSFQPLVALPSLLGRREEGEADIYIYIYI
jgi:hypothetical protein